VFHPQQDILNNWQMTKPLGLTYVLGSRCADGVTIIADNKFTICNGPTEYLFDTDKITGEFPGYLTAFSDKRDKFERFRSEIREFRSSQPCQISIDKTLISMSDIMERINPKLSEGFELLVGISGAYFPDKKSVLKHFYKPGGYVPVNTYKALGSETFGRIYLRHWHDGMTMSEVAELGYFIVKYIQSFKLDESVGEDEAHPINIRFIPNNPSGDKLDYPPDGRLLKEFEERTQRRLDRVKDDYNIGPKP
jgi:hypothetical protein